MWIRMIVLSMTGLMTVVFSPDAVAQQADEGGGRRGGRGGARSEQPEGPTVRCFGVTQSDPTKIADYSGQLYGRGRVVDMPATGRSLFMGTEHEIAQVETLLKEIDVPEMETDSEPALTILPIHHRRAHDVLSNVHPIMSGLPDNALRITADDARSSIIVLSRSTKALEAVRQMIAGLDTPTTRVAMEFAFFRADLNASGDKPVIPEDLQEVANELGRFGQVSLLGRLFADGTEGARFKVEGQIHDHVTARINGRVEYAAQGGPTRISLEAKALMEVVRTAETEGGGVFAKTRSNGTFAIETQLQVMPDQFVVVGGSPAGVAEGQSIMLAVRVRP